jgi:hypothetical protein
MCLGRAPPPFGWNSVAVPQLAEARIGNPDDAGSRPVRHLRLDSIAHFDLPLELPRSLGRSPLSVLLRPMPTVEFHYFFLQMTINKPPRSCNFRGRDQRKVSSAGNSKGSAFRRRCGDSRLGRSGRADPRSGRAEASEAARVRHADADRGSPRPHDLRIPDVDANGAPDRGTRRARGGHRGHPLGVGLLQVHDQASRALRCARRVRGSAR